MANDSSIESKLEEEYADLMDFFRYIELRLTIDISRMIRRSNMNGKVFFSTRIKEFSSLQNKLYRKISSDLDVESPFSRIRSIEELIFSDQRIVSDIVGLRLICLNERVMKDVIQRFMWDKTFRIIPVNYYQIILSDRPDHFLRKFLHGAGFAPDNPDLNKDTFRRYEDVNLYLMFQNIRDLNRRYDYEFREETGSLLNESDPDKILRVAVNKHLDQLNPELVAKIKDFRVEVQIVSLLMFVFNETQRPEYLARKGYNFGMSDIEKRDLSLLLDSMKLSLNSAAVALDLCLDRSIGPDSFRPSVRLGANYDVGPRLSKRLTPSLREKVIKLNELAADVTKERTLVPQFFALLRNICEEYGEPLGVLGDLDLNEDGGSKDTRSVGVNFEDDEYIEYWKLNRNILMILAVVSGYSNNIEGVNGVREIISWPPFADDGGLSENKVADSEKFSQNSESMAAEITNRIYSHVADFDKHCARSRKGNRDIERYIVDPLVKLRQATIAYQDSDFVTAQKEIQVGIDLYNYRIENDLDCSAKILPHISEFMRRDIEYYWCELFSNKRMTSSHCFRLIKQIGEVPRLKIDSDLQDRLECYRIMLAFHAITEIDREIQSSIHKSTIEHAINVILTSSNHITYRISAAGDDDVVQKAWFSIASSIMFLVSGDFENARERVTRAKHRIDSIGDHPGIRLQMFTDTLHRVSIAIAASIADEQWENLASDRNVNIEIHVNDIRDAYTQIRDSYVRSRDDDKNSTISWASSLARFVSTFRDAVDAGWIINQITK